MKSEVGIVALVAFLLAGCGGSPGSNFSSPSAADVTGNWQIQTSANSTTSSPQGVVLLGALQSSGSQVSGTFRFTNLAHPDACGSNQVVTLTGAAQADGSLALASAAMPNGATVKVSLTLTGTAPYSGIGTVEVDGNTCALASQSAIGSQVASTTGTFTGTLSPGDDGDSDSDSGTPGSATMTLTQSSVAGTDGQFTETGTLNYKFGSCSGQVPLNGSVSGVGMSFWEVIFTSGGQQVLNLSGTTNLAATQITAGSLSLTPAPCSADPDSNATFTGQLKRQ